jgi:transcriptional regulator with XRE-family HTH domain
MVIKLADIRASKGLTQTQLAEMADISQETISLYETGKQKPLPDNLIRLASALDCTVDELLGLDEGRSK